MALYGFITSKKRKTGVDKYILNQGEIINANIGMDS